MLVLFVEFIKVRCRDGLVHGFNLGFYPLQHFVGALVLIGFFHKPLVLHHFGNIILHPGLLVPLRQTAQLGE
jgi:hypothetical protein